MTKQSLIRSLLAGLALLAAFGCDSNPTNEPAKTDIDKANAARAKAIDDDQSLTPEGKAKMKEMMGLNKGQTDQREGAAPSK